MIAKTNRPGPRAAAVLLAALLTALLAGGLLCGLSGCSGDDDPTATKPDASPRPESESVLLQLLGQACEDRDAATYAALLDAGFEFLPQDADLGFFGLPSGYRIDRDEEASIAANLFSGQPSPSTGEAGVRDIRFNVMDGVGQWADSQNPLFPGCRFRAFNFELEFERPGATTLVVKGQQEFYCARIDTSLPGIGPVSYWRLRGQVDLSDTGGKGVEGPSWGYVKLLYRDAISATGE